MKAVEIVEPGKAELIEIERPKPAAGEVLISVSVTGICGSDISAFAGTHPFRIPPVVSGHEVSGIVSEVGAGVIGVAEGDYVVIEPQLSCGACEFCLSGHYNLCTSKTMMGTSRWPGSFAEFVTAPAGKLLKVPGGVSAGVATLIEPLAVGLHAIGRSGIEAGDNIAVIGAGPIGLTLLIGLGQMEPGRILCTDLKPGNLKICEELGAFRAIKADDERLQSTAMDATGGRGVDISFVAVPSEKALNQAIEITKPNGRVVLIALFDDLGRTNLQDLQLRQKEIVGTVTYTRDDFMRGISYLPNICNQLGRLITHEVELDELPDTLKSLSNGELDGAIKVIVNVPGRTPKS